LEAAGTAAVHAIRLRLAASRRGLEQCETKLQQLSPLKILERGYAIVSTPNGAILKEPVLPGSALEIRLAKGTMPAKAM
jgi:exodeoxyribonuclease VII large subunit